MSTQMTRNAPPPSSSRERLLKAAQDLFAEHGVHGVGLRDIAKTAGHKNANSIRYHFGSKEKLIKAIIAWGGKQGEMWRQERLDELESGGRQPTTRELIDIVLRSALAHESSAAYVRFIAHVTLSHRELIWETYRQAVGDSMARCYEHLRRSIKNVPEQILEQRFAFLEIYVQHVIFVWTSERKSRNGRSHWSSPQFFGNLFDTVEGMLTAPCRAACESAPKDLVAVAGARGGARRR